MILAVWGAYAAMIFRPLILLVFIFWKAIEPSPVRIVESGLGIELPRGTQVAHWYNDHGGFHGDGCAFAALEPPCGDLEGRFDPQAAGWQEVPLSKDAQTAFYGWQEVRNGTVHTIGSCLPEGCEVPPVSEGYWVLMDRQKGKTGSIFAESRNSQNFTAALWDAETETLYYLQKDT